MVAGVLLQGAAPALIDSAGIELDTTLGSWDYLWNRPLDALAAAARPGRSVRRRSRVSRCPHSRSSVASTSALRLLGGRRPRAALQLGRLALRPGVRRARPAQARSDARRGVAAAQRRLEAFGRGYVLAKYRVARSGPADAGKDRSARLAGARRPPRSCGARRAPRARASRALATACGLPGRRAPLELATVGFVTAVRRQSEQLRLRLPARCRPTSQDEAPTTPGLAQVIELAPCDGSTS